MKNSIITLLITLTLVVSMTACGQKQAESSPSPTTTTSNVTPSVPEQIADSSHPEQDRTTNTTQVEPMESSTAETIEKTYHMNKVYNIVPNDDTTEKKVVLLTFDDGPKEAKMINGLIDTLDKHHAKAIFFVNGYRVKSHPELLQLIHERDQIIGNHSWDHINLKKESDSKIKQQIEDVQAIVKKTIGESPKFFRPPFGIGNDTVRKVVKEQGMLFMTWSNGSLDWDSKNKNKPDAVIKNVLEQLHPGSNILMHELPWTVEALDELLTKLEEKGYSFVDPRAIDFDKSLK
ncbi:xylanase deacetylase [Paenibacillus selenitireducens]|uniref:Xylanase deacetylase n=2 Tax=Paenibacillus selenitireducens TaxID=1324314 RepID=A0A1T2XNL0_9BACL|nr:polysaccharide deacetylase family protein [Paenibacillus selenitireducens]OPA81412.1 xylanase deacetylase [Paenibacillus selenitireducens]